jgi:hypothetical protein
LHELINFKYKYFSSLTLMPTPQLSLSAKS